MTGPKYEIGKDGNTIVLANWCERCGGYATEPGDQGKTCIECDGFGALITTDGSQILALVNDILLKGRK